MKFLDIEVDPALTWGAHAEELRLRLESEYFCSENYLVFLVSKHVDLSVFHSGRNSPKVGRSIMGSTDF